MKTKRSRLVVHVILPLSLGGLMYICLRDPKLLMFQWFDFIGLGQVVQQLRAAASPLQTNIPFWIQFSLPNATWVYALTCFMALIWGETNSRTKPVWLSLGLLLGAGTELGQAAGLIPGKFDAVDLLLCFLAVTLALLLNRISVPSEGRLNDIAT